VAAPSVHASGRVYSWIDDRPPAQLPRGWIEQLLRNTRRRDRAEEIQASHILGFDKETVYGRAALERELERLLRVSPGERNEALNRSVFRLAQLVAGNQLPLVRLEREAAELAYVLGLEAVEARETIRSAVAAGLRFPRSPSRVRGCAEVNRGNRSRSTSTTTAASEGC
jgi:hypothetical protein